MITEVSMMIVVYIRFKMKKNTIMNLHLESSLLK